MHHATFYLKADLTCQALLDLVCLLTNLSAFNLNMHILNQIRTSYCCHTSLGGGKSHCSPLYIYLKILENCKNVAANRISVQYGL